MNIKFEGKYFPVNSFEWNSIPKIAIITGLNGVGKTHLLNLINEGIRGQNNAFSPLTNANSSRNISHPNSDNSGKITLDGIEINSINEFGFIRSLGLVHNNKEFTLDEHSKIISEINVFHKTKYIEKGHPRNSSVKILNESYPVINILKKISENSSIPIEELDSDSIVENFDLTDFFSNKLSTNESLPEIFFDFHYRREVFKYETRKSDEDFETPPWVKANQILEKIGLPYKFNTPEHLNILNIQRSKEGFNLEIIDKRNGLQFPLQHLSSGELFLISLALIEFNQTQFGVTPKILLLDEPDAHLHPSMIKNMLNVFEYLAECGVQIIFTSHSPSTVALAPKESLFLMERGSDRILNTKKDALLSILTTGVPSFSVNYENRRQVFVESPNDVMFYDKLYRKLRSSLIPEISLSFISSGESRTDKNGTKVANCDQVKNICKTLRETGNQFIWGIIDWDTNNNPGEFEYIKVLGDGNRYAIENYILDPILIAAILLRVKKIEKSDVGLTEEQTFMDIDTLENEKLQNLSNYIVSKVKEKVDPQDNLEDVLVTYLNEKSVKIPKWYLIHQGHELEDKLVEAFYGLGEIKRGQEEKLKLEIVDTIIDDMPGLIPIDILDAFKYIQAT